jgi:hypothetical protein
MFNNWNGYTLKRQLLIITSSLTILSLGSIIVACVIFVTIISSNSSKALNDNFLTYTSNNIGNVLQGGSRYLNTRLNKLNGNFINGIDIFTQDSFRTDYPFSFIKNNISSVNYYDSNIETDENIINFTNRTSTLEYIFPIELANNNDFYSVSITKPNKITRMYPKNPTYPLNWNPTTINKEILYSAIHDNYLLNNFIVTISKNIFEPYTGSNIGVITADMSTKIFEQSIENMIYQQSRSILFETDTGNVIADTSQKITNIKKYQQITNPQITVELWNRLLNEPNVMIENDGYYYISVYLHIINSPQNKYLIISSIDKSIVLNVFSQMVNSINNILKTQILTVIITSCVSFVLALGLCFYFTWKISTPLQELANASSQMSKQIGEDNIANNINFNVGNTGISEIDNVIRVFKNTVTNISNANNNDQLYSNPYYNSNNWNSIFHPPEQINTLSNNHSNFYRGSIVIAPTPSAPAEITAPPLTQNSVYFYNNQI